MQKNVNFSEDRFFEYLYKLEEIKEGLLKDKEDLNEVASYRLPETEGEILHDAENINITEENEDVKSLKDIIIYGLKGIAAYTHHAYVLREENKDIYEFIYKALRKTVTEEDRGNLLDVALEVGKVNLSAMELLDKGNTETFGHPEPTDVNINKVKGPFIVVSGHDLKDLKMLLEQTKDKGINIYTHGEMLPAHAYPELKKYDHLVGNLGGAWQDQQKEFNNLPGAILMTTNCIQKPRGSYKDRIYTTSVVGFEDIKHIGEDKDFAPLIEKAIELGGFKETEEKKKIKTGFARNAVLSNADTIVDYVKNGDIKHFFLIGGCDGVRHGRSYFTDFAKNTPEDSIILTLACGKYRFNKLEFGEIKGLPRLLDVGQCNDAYSAIKIALALKEAFDCDINELPLSMILSWYEQKAVSILLTLLYLNIQDIHLGPTLPQFISENVLNILVDNYNIRPTGDAKEDLNRILS